VNDDVPQQDVPAHLQVMPRYRDSQRWNVYRLVDDPPTIRLAASVSSYDEAKRRAARGGEPLWFAGKAWQEMVGAGVAPRAVPQDVTIV
jgi:hypothetical protein